MTEQEAINYIENHSWSKTRLGLDRTRQLMELLNNPQKHLRFIHVAGSNGKGSTCAMTASILMESGYRVGFYSSPYLQTFNERIKINGVNIPGNDLAVVVEKVKAAAEKMPDHPSQFELITAAGFLYFLKEKCDIVVLEVGMGGEFDATNVIDAPEAAVITNIGLEHTEYLGDTIEKIAAAKGGIIKPGCRVICYDGDKRAVSTIDNICRQRGAELIRTDFSLIKAEGSDLAEAIRRGRPAQIPVFQYFSYKDEKYRLRLLAKHQLCNAVMAIETAKTVSETFDQITPGTIKTGLERTGWPARFEVLDTDPLFILDGGHNPQCAAALDAALSEISPDGKFIFVLGVLADKDYDEIIGLIKDRAACFVCLTPDSDRALDAGELAGYLREKGLPAYSSLSISEGLDMAREMLEKAPAEAGIKGIIAFGSLYLAGIIRTEMQKRETL